MKYRKPWPEQFGVSRGDETDLIGERLVAVELLRSGWETDVIKADEHTAASEWRVMLRDDQELGSDAVGWCP